jgi:hypothetical protein
MILDLSDEEHAEHGDRYFMSSRAKLRKAILAKA